MQPTSLLRQAQAPSSLIQTRQAHPPPQRRDSFRGQTWKGIKVGLASPTVQCLCHSKGSVLESRPCLIVTSSRSLSEGAMHREEVDLTPNLYTHTHTHPFTPVQRSLLIPPSSVLQRRLYFSYQLQRTSFSSRPPRSLPSWRGWGGSVAIVGASRIGYSEPTSLRMELRRPQRWGKSLD